MFLTTHLYGGPGVTDQDAAAQLGFFFRFQRLDVSGGRFIYTATGSVAESATAFGQGCSGSGSDSAGHAPWPVATSNFNLSFALDRYLGVVAASNEPKFNITVTCEGQTTQTPVDMLDLRIGFGRPQPLYPYSTKISEQTTVEQGVYNVNYQWSLQADVP